LLEDVPMSDEQEKQSLIEEWTNYASEHNSKTFEATNNATIATNGTIKAGNDTSAGIGPSPKVETEHPPTPSPGNELKSEEKATVLSDEEIMAREIEEKKKQRQ